MNYLVELAVSEYLLHFTGIGNVAMNELKRLCQSLYLAQIPLLDLRIVKGI
jgi:hypothetical protein